MCIPDANYQWSASPFADEPVADEPDFALALEEARRNLDSLNGRLTDLRNRSLQ